MTFKELKQITRNFSSRLTSPTQTLYATIIVGCILDSIYFIIYSSIIKSNVYTSVHFALDLLVAFGLVIYYTDAIARDALLIDLEATFRPRVQRLFPRWVFNTIDNTEGDRKNLVIRVYLLLLLFLLDCTIITVKILCFGCLIYFRIHFALSFIMVIFFFVCLRASYRYNAYVIAQDTRNLKGADEGAQLVAAFYEAQRVTRMPEASSTTRGDVEAQSKMHTVNGFEVYGNQHPYHMVQKSILPFVTAFGTFDVLSSTVKYFHYGWAATTKLHVSVGLIILIVAVAVWLWAIVQESMEGHHTLSVRWNLVHGFILFILSEVMLFFSIFWAFFHSSLAPSIALYCSWPPIGIIPILWNKAPLLNTSLLVISGLWLTASHFSLLSRHFESTSSGLIWTLTLGFLFTLVQGFEYVKSSFCINDSVFGSVFFLSTGFHGLHVIVGSIMLAVALYRNALRQFVPLQHIGFSTAGWYWHFVDAVWLFLFVSVYWWGGL